MRGGTLCRPAARTALFYLLGAAALAVSLCAGSLNVLFPIPMGGPGYAALALLVFAILSWCLMLAPIAVTALAVLVLLPFTGLMDFGQVVSTGFGDSTFGFFLGVLLLSAAFQKTHLGRRIALVIFRIFGCKPRCVLFGLMLAGMLLAMWVTEVASAAILYPLAFHSGARSHAWRRVGARFWRRSHTYCNRGKPCSRELSGAICRNNRQLRALDEHWPSHCRHAAGSRLVPACKRDTP